MSLQAAPRLLMVEDDPDTASLMIEALTDHFGAKCVDHRSSVALGLAADLSQYDLVLSDMNLPDGTGLEVISKMLLRRPDLPIVLVTGEGVLENAITAIKRGAYDYIVKAGEYLFTIPLIVEKNLAIWRTKQDNLRLQEQLTRTLEELRVKNTQLQGMVGKLQTAASTDPLTGLANRRSFNQALDRSFAECARYGHDLACIMIDLDGFKALNDTLGHQRGDELLIVTSRVLEANCRRSDVAGRFGGDEFVVVLPETDLPTAKLVAGRIGSEFASASARLLAEVARAPRVSMSMGLACLRHSNPSNPEQLIAYADHALYSAKQSGKDRLMVYDPAAAQPAVSGLLT